MLAETLAHGWPKLHVLDLRFNKLKDAGAQALAKGFAGLPGLQKLYLRRNLIKDPTAKRAVTEAVPPACTVYGL